MKKNKLISLILAITFVMSMFSGISVSASELPDVSASIYGASDIAGKTEFSGTLRTVAKVSEETTVKFIVAVYNGEALQTATTFDVTLLPEDTVLDIPYTVTGLEGAENQTAKAYLWKDVDSLEPLTNAMPVEGEIGVRVEGLPIDYNTFTAVIDGYTPTKDDVVTYKWEYRDNTTAAGVYLDASTLVHDEETATEKTFTPILTSATFRRFRVTVTINDIPYTNSVLIGATDKSALRILHNDSLSQNNKILNYANKTTPAEYVFTADGMEFILLDSIPESDSAAFMMMTKNSVGERIYTVANISDNRSINQYPYDMVAWLNNKSAVSLFGGRNGQIKDVWSGADYTETGYIGNEGYTQIPESVLSHVADDVYRHTERGAWWHDGSFPDYYVATQGGLQLLSLTELVKYGDKIGLADCGDWWLRTPAINDTGASSSHGGGIQAVDADVLGTTEIVISYTNAGGAVNTSEIRPSFYADKDFFLEVPVDLATAGAAVIKTIAERYTRDELLAAGYSETDLAAYLDPVVNYSGSVETAVIKSEGTFEVNNTLKLEYTGTNLEDAKIQWYTSLTDLGCFVEVEGATDDTFIPSDSEAGKYVKAKITLKNGSTKDSNVIKLADALNAAASYDGTTTQIGKNEEDQEEYIFEIADADDTTATKLVLLDTTESDASHFLVMTNSYVGLRYYSWMAVRGSSDETNNLTLPYTNTPLDMTAWLNGLDEVTMYANSEQVMMPDYEYTVTPTEADGKVTYDYTYEQKTDEEGNLLTRPAYGAYNYGSDGYPLIPVQLNAGTKPTLKIARSILPETVWASVNQNQVWNCEPYTASGKTTRYAVKGGIMLPSVTEIAKYADKINLYPGGRNTGGSVQNKLNSCWWTRTPSGSTAAYCVNFENVGQTTSRNYHTEGNAGLRIRPIFYLDRDFFVDNVIDLSAAGSDVCSKIRATYTNEELLTAGYLQEDIDTYLGAEVTE